MADEDRLSQLPEPISEKIFFLLHWDDAAQMSVVAKTWRDMWAKFPVLDFNFDQNRCACYPKWNSKLEQETREFMNSIDKALVDIRPGKAIIKKFRLCFYFADPEIASRIDGWIGLATDNFVRKLAIGIEHGTDTYQYSIPTKTLLAKPVKVLSLEGCKLEQPLFVDMGKYFYFRKVSFVEVCFDVEALLGFLNLCPALEDFSIILCKGLDSLFIPYLPKLERLMVAVCENPFRRVEINATNLQFFSYKAVAESSIVDELDISIAARTQLREVYISGVNITDNLLEELVSKLPLLHNLTLTRCSSMERVIKVSHHLLETLSLCLDNDLLLLEIETPNLRYFKYGVNILPDVFTINAPNLQESYLEVLPRDCVDALWFLNLRRYLSNFERLDELRLSFGGSVDTFSLDKLNEYETPPLPVVKHLKAEMIGFLINCDAYLDGLLWSCHPEILLVEYVDQSDVQFIRFLSEKLINRDEYPRCCDSSRIRCWRHCIKDVMNEELMVAEDRDAFLSSLTSKGRGEVRFQLKW